MANIINGTDTGSGGLITTGDSSDELQLQTAETARVTLTNTAVVVNEGGNDVDFRVEGDTDANLLFVDAGTDRVGIGTSSPSGKLNLSDSTSCQLNINSSAAGATRQVLFSTSSNTQEALISSNNATGELKFESGRSGTTAYFQTFYTNNTERLRILPSGGITFNGDTAAANALDDYEEGTWTPTDASGAGLTFGATTSARYTKIGNKVFVDAEIEFPSTASGATIAIGGLPFTSENTNNYSVGPGMNDANLNAWVFVNPNGTTFSVYVTSSNFTQATNAQFSTKFLYCSVAYTAT